MAKPAPVCIFGAPPRRLNADQRQAWLDLGPRLEQLDRPCFIALVHLRAATAPPVYTPARRVLPWCGRQRSCSNCWASKQRSSSPSDVFTGVLHSIGAGGSLRGKSLRPGLPGSVAAESTGPAPEAPGQPVQRMRDGQPFRSDPGQPEARSPQRIPQGKTVIHNVDPTEQLADLSRRAMSIEDAARKHNRSCTPAEQAEVDRLTAEFFSLEQHLATPQRRLTQPEPVNSSDGGYQRITGGERVGATRGSNGFESVGAWAHAVADASKGKTDGRLMNAPTGYGQEAVGADGGFAVPPDFRQEIINLVNGEESLLALTDQQTTSSNALTLPIDTSTPWATSGGVLATWEAEAAPLTQSKPQLGQLECKLNKLSCFVPVSDELLEDAPALSRWLPTKVGQKFNSKLNAAIIAGTGVGMPLGLLNSGGKITQTAVTGQGANTVVATNILKMFSRLAVGSRKTAVWIVNPELEQQLQAMVMPGTTTAIPLYLPGGSLIGPPAATLFGRPVVVVEAASAVGTEGDIILADLRQYLTCIKAGGMRSDFSISVFFDLGISCFRFSLRIGGQPYLGAPIPRMNGNSTSSTVVTLNSTRT